MKHAFNTLLITTSLVVLSLSVPALAEKNRVESKLDKSLSMPYIEKADIQILTRADVKKIQKALSYYKYNTGPHDGILGARTTSAIQAFQQNNNLTADGTIRTSTLEKLNIEVSSLDNYVPDDDQILSKKERTDYSLIEPASGKQEFDRRVDGRQSYSMDHQDIKIIQKGLRDKGYELGQVDGIWGPSTDRALREFQRDRGLVVDGLITSSILNELNTGYQNHSKKY